jgi:putative zinc finger protein
MTGEILAKPTDAALLAQVNAQLIEANRQLAIALSRVRDLERQVAQLMCWGLIPFSDNELDAERADAFRVHLGTCEDCQRSLVWLQQLDARMSSARPMERDRG